MSGVVSYRFTRKGVENPRRSVVARYRMLLMDWVYFAGWSGEGWLGRRRRGDASYLMLSMLSGVGRFGNRFLVVLISRTITGLFFPEQIRSSAFLVSSSTHSIGSGRHVLLAGAAYQVQAGFSPGCNGAIWADVFCPVGLVHAAIGSLSGCRRAQFCRNLRSERFPNGGDGRGRC